jgi:1-acyl-sn-glycerol-3-phosphate acyltransferase
MRDNAILYNVSNNKMNDIVNLIKTIILYILVPFRIIFLFILLRISNVVLYFIRDESSIMSVILIFGKFLMFILSLNIDLPKEDFVKYMNYLYSDEKFICTFNHTTLVDGFVLASAFPRGCYVILRTIVYNIFGYTDENNEKYGNIYVEKGKTSNIIKGRVDNRKSGDPIVFIAPGSGNIPKIPGNITEFSGKGAFVEGYPILPIVIKYEDNSLHHNSDNGESMLHSWLKLFLVQNYKIKIKVCDMIERKGEESVLEYKDRVYDIMNDEYKKM